MKSSYPVFPIKAGLIITNRCLYQCKHCYVSSNETKYHELDTRTWCNIIDELERAGIFEVYVGGGEPFVRSDSYAILKHALKKNLDVGTSTNAAILNAEKAERIPRDVHVQVSLDGIGEKHEAIRGIGTYGSTMRGIQALLKLGRDITIATTVNRYNMNHLDVLHNTIRQLGIKSWHIIRPMPCGRALRNWDIFSFSNQEWIETVRRLTKLSEIDESMKFSIDKTFDIDRMDKIEPRHADMFWPDMDEMCILPNGDIVTCDLLMHEHRYVIGNILQVSDLWELWKNSQVIRILLTSIAKISGKCRHCRLFYLCKGGSRYVAEELLNDPYAPDPMCPHEPPKYVSYK